MNIEWERLRLAPKHPFRISRSVQESVELVWVRIEADGVEGWGEAAPSVYYGETADTVEAALTRLAPVVRAAAQPEALETIEAELARTIGHNAAARAAVSAALHDLVGKRAGLPVWKLWGLEPGSAPLSSFTIGIGDPAEVAAKVEEAVEWPILKVKVGTGRDEEILAAVRGAAPDKRLRVDANGAWTAREAVDRMRLLADHGVEFVEQPLPPWDRAGYRFLHGRAPLPVIVDESCLVATDVPGLVGHADGINIKLAKCGSLREALRMIHVARACGLQVMLGCMLESTLGIAAAAQLAPLLDHADLDGAALLAEDPFRGPGLESGSGSIRLVEAPGLGVERR